MDNTELFWLLDKQLLHQWGNDMVASMGYLELLQSEKLPHSAKHITRKLGEVSMAHQVHIELYRRALGIYRHQSNVQAVRSADILLGLHVTEKIVQGFMNTQFLVQRDKPLVSVMIDQTALNQILTFLFLVSCFELQPKNNRVSIGFRRRNNYISTRISFQAKKASDQSSLLAPAISFVNSILKPSSGSVSIQTDSRYTKVFLRLLVSKQMKLI